MWRRALHHAAPECEETRASRCHLSSGVQDPFRDSVKVEICEVHVDRHRRAPAAVLANVTSHTFHIVGSTWTYSGETKHSALAEGSDPSVGR